jgi:hypothetical protein
VIILYDGLVPDVTVYDTDPVPLDIVKLFVTKLALAPDVTSATVPDVRLFDSCDTVPDIVIYGALKRLWFHSAETTGVNVIESELVKTDEDTLLSIISP